MIVKCGDDLRQELLAYQLMKQIQVHGILEIIFRTFTRNPVIVEEYAIFYFCLMPVKLAFKKLHLFEARAEKAVFNMASKYRRKQQLFRFWRTSIKNPALISLLLTDITLVFASSSLLSLSLFTSTFVEN